MYAVVAPGFSCVYSSWSDVERIKALYPYPKWCKCSTETEAQAWIKRNSYSNKLSSIYNYGNTSAASIPILLDELKKNGRIKAGDKTIISGFGAGLSWGAILVEW